MPNPRRFKNVLHGREKFTYGDKTLLLTTFTVNHFATVAV